MHTREEIIAAARKLKPETGDTAMIAVGELGYWVGCDTYVSKQDVDLAADKPARAPGEGRE